MAVLSDFQCSVGLWSAGGSSYLAARERDRRLTGSLRRPELRPLASPDSFPRHEASKLCRAKTKGGSC